MLSPQPSRKKPSFFIQSEFGFSNLGEHGDFDVRALVNLPLWLGLDGSGLVPTGLCFAKCSSRPASSLNVPALNVQHPGLQILVRSSVFRPDQHSLNALSVRLTFVGERAR